ncbi:MAG: symmetrical bis(5'-nucleosyl)-tetraphosphatase [Comamonadaceae bacterium]|nr:symmetrical bis(5'-nucleosyl)-tetraphosphatase [Comamonadaceae bacterium]
MSTYLIGDIQGCDHALQRLLQQISFSASRDTLYLLGDLINRGPESAQVLRRCMALGDAVKPLLGNHDLHLLATAHGFRKPGKRDTLKNILQAPDSGVLLDWVAQQPLARSLESSSGQRLLMVHAGVLPQWTFEDTLNFADEVHHKLQGEERNDFLAHMYGNLPNQWSPDLTGADRLRVVVNALTRIRFCSANGIMDFESSESADAAPEGLMPWFECPGRKTAQDIIAFGHWSTLGLMNRSHLMALDTGCVWGGCLTAMEIGSDFHDRHIHQVHCEQAQKPG